MLYWEQAIIVVYVIVNVSGMIANLTVFYMFQFHTPSHLRRFSLLLLHNAIWDFVGNTNGLFAIPRLIPTGLGFSVVSHGICQYFSHSTCVLTYCTMVSFQFHSMMTLPISFFYRWWILEHGAPSTWILVFALLVLLPFPISQNITCSTSLSENADRLFSKLQEVNQTDAAANGVLFGVSNIATIGTVHTIICYTFISPIVYTMVFVFRRKVRLTMEKLGLAMNAQKKELHVKLLRVITLQALAPMLFCICAVDYFTIQFLFSTVGCLQYFVVLPINCVSLVQPLITLFYVEPYRRALFGASRTSSMMPASTTKSTTAVSQRPEEDRSRS